MTDAKSSILVVDDDQSILQVLEARLLSAGYRVSTASSAEKAVERLENHPADLVLSDIRMPGMGGAGLLAWMAENLPGVPVILLTAYGTIPDAVDMMRQGAADYLTKPFDGAQLLAKVEAMLAAPPAATAPAAQPAPAACETPTAKRLTERFWGGQSSTMKAFLDRLGKAAASDANVLLLGESGTGKELVARILHECGPRAAGPFVIVDCGSTPASLLESELFGHVKGSFTHAVKDKSGLIEEADGGTLFLDEIGNISPEMQTRLLRFLQEGTIRRVGDNKQRAVACRVVAATNADLPALVREGSFREDLYFRLKVVTLTIPPLRQRPEDTPVLAQRFLDEFCAEQGREPVRFDQTALGKIAAHPWPGNVRELKHAIEAGLVFCQNGVLTADDLALEPPENLAETTAPASVSSGDDALSLESREKQAIVAALERTGGVKKAAADLLGISRRAIHYKIQKYGIDA